MNFIVFLSRTGFIPNLTRIFHGHHGFFFFRESYNVTQEATSKKSLPWPLKTIYLKCYIKSVYNIIQLYFWLMNHILNFFGILPSLYCYNILYDVIFQHSRILHHFSSKRYKLIIWYIVCIIAVYIRKIFKIMKS